MNDLDDTIRKAMIDEDAEAFDKLSEQSMAEMVIDSFRTRQRWLIAIVFLWTLVMFAASVVCLVQFFRVENDREAIAWGGGFIFGMIAVGLLKTWYFMELNKNSVMREIKRMELQIARLSSRLESRDAPGSPSV